MYQVIVSACDIYGQVSENVLLFTRASKQVAQDEAQEYCKEGRLVVIRPLDNLQDQTGATFFREWKSVNGQSFQEVRYSSR